ARGGPKGHDGPPPPPPSKAAEFRFKRGPLEVAVRCSELEPIKPCADAANQLMDKFAALSEPGLMPGDRSTASDPLPGGETAPGSGGPALEPKP
ncbi:hypothetical protein, partial [Tianweitania sp.]|uniref:hypothetical protein n=1 Tax=Tianweitania sp. TaxID=2021634 RepID=UPI0028983C8C